MSDLKDLKLTIESGVPLIVLESQEEDRVIEMVSHLGFRNALPVWGWTLSDGLRRMDLEGGVPRADLADAEAALRHVKAQTTPGLFLFCDLHPFLRDQPVIVRLLKDIALAHARIPHTLVLVSHQLQLPEELRRFAATFRLRLPTEDELQLIIREEAQAWSRNHGGRKVKSDAESVHALVRNLRGTTFSDARRLARGAIADDGAISLGDVPVVNRARFDMLAAGGVLQFEFDTANFGQVAGLAKLRNWLHDRQTVFLGRRPPSAALNNFVIDPPRGILLTGVQGGGKSLAARAVAGSWNVPLLRLDFGALYNKFHGETERNLREALAAAEAVAPCVLWMDEIEKGIAAGDNDGGTSRRVLGTLLTWMAERKAPVFAVATANDIARLPAELVRKGRFDEIFFVDLPGTEVRRDALRIHLARRNQVIEHFNLEQLADACAGYTGAEIEQVVVAALYSALARQEPLTTTHMLRAIQATSPLSVTMAEQVAALRAWARERAVNAD